MIKKIIEFFEKQAYGVCAWWGDKLGIRAHRIRLSFIYLSFITFGSPLIVYLIMAFILENREVLTAPRKRATIWELD
jgi:phage shock protein PspC (stress-responsive transcriptional regulator)